MAKDLKSTLIRNILRKEINESVDKFELIKAVTTLLQEDKSVGEELVLRLLARREDFKQYETIIDSLIRKIGLFPYLNQEDLSLEDTIAFEFHKPDGLGDGTVFHHAQAEIYHSLVKGENIVLSAPTSFGKSLIIDAIIATRKHRNIAVIVPTIALIDETRKRLSKYRNDYKVITHPSQELKEKNIFILTQERALDIINTTLIDFFVIDEFYKLSPTKSDKQRSQILNHVFYLLVKQQAQFYLLGPNIEQLTTEVLSNVSFKFIKTDFKTVVSEVHRVKVKKGENSLDVLRSLTLSFNEPTLIFCKSPASANKVAEFLSSSLERIYDQNRELARWLEENYHEKWVLPECLRKGIGIHHGKIPRAIAQKSIGLFNEGNIKFLICTSTIIEGVNTKAKNVVIYDNKIARSKFDYFTFNNICGRSGRMLSHFIGNIYLFHEPPPAELPLVDFPIFTQNDDVPEELLINISQDDLKQNSKDKIQKYIEQDQISLEVLQQNSFINLDLQIKLAKHIEENFEELLPLISWSSVPNNQQLKTACILIWNYFVDSKQRIYGVSSGKQLHYRILQFREAGNLKNFISNFVAEGTELEEINKSIEEAFDVQRYWINFQFPRYLVALDKIVNYILQKNNLKGCDYLTYASQVECYFTQPYVVSLDEYGLPIPISLKIGRLIDLDGDIDKSLAQLKNFNPDGINFSKTERDFIIELQEYI